LNNLPEIHTKIPGPRSSALAERLGNVESPNVTCLSDDFPVFWESAQGALVTDVDGNVYLDMTSAFGVGLVGHCHPAVVTAIQSQSARLIHGMGDVHPSAIKVELCEAIAARVPIPHAQVILGQNGADAVEAAMKTAMLATGRPGVLAFDGGYHGLSYGTLSVTSRPDFRAAFIRQLKNFATHLPYGCPPSDVEKSIARAAVGGVLLEPLQGRGGIVAPPPGWLRTISEICSRRNVILILDEIFTGWGRTGELFACTADGVVPDILCVGKALGGGLPISACVAGRDIMSHWPKSQGEAIHTSTFLGNPLACAAALATLSVIDQENLVERSRSLGGELSAGLRSLAAKAPAVIRDVRGRGLMLGLEMSSPAAAQSLIAAGLRKGVIMLPAGDGRVIELIPPLVVTEAQIAWFLDCLDSLVMAA
jgi:4-aminobutyrate aminotransferase-like enzyme